MLVLAAAAAATVACWRVATARVDGDGVLAAGQVRGLYDRLAPGYDVLAGVYRLLGARRLARQAVVALQLQPGDTVVDLGCGTGRLLPVLADAVAPGGRVVGVDLSPRMLDRACARMAARADVEVQLVQEDIRQFDWPDTVDAVIATFALEMVPEYDRVVADAARAVAPTDGRIAICGLRAPDRWPSWAIRAGIAISRPFGVHEDYLPFHPWEAVRRHTREVVHESTGGRALYLSVGQAG